MKLISSFQCCNLIKFLKEDKLSECPMCLRFLYIQDLGLYLYMYIIKAGYGLVNIKTLQLAIIALVCQRSSFVIPDD